MTKDNLYVNNEAREKLMAGIRKAAIAVGGTMGTGGSNALIEAIENPGHLATNDGATILSSIYFADPIEDMGRKILLEAVSRANKQSGDGSSTTTVLTASIIEEGLAFLGTHNSMDIKRSLEACIPLIEKAIADQTKQITVDEVSKVATISAEDKGIGDLIQEIYQQIGKDGIIHWDISKTTEDTYSVGSGLTIEGAGFLSPYMCDIDEKTGQFSNQARWSNPNVLLVKQKITSASDFNGLFKALFDKEIKEVVVFCDEIEATVIPDLIQTRAVRGFKTLVIKMPVIWKDEWYADLAKASGATVIDPNAGITLKTMTLEHLGKVGNIVVSREDTFIDGIKDLTDHLEGLEEEGTDEAKNRIARLNTKTARLYIGAVSDSALSYKRLKVEDAISAAWQALQGGVVPGGGSALVEATGYLPATVGGDILNLALRAPARQIATNAGILAMDVDGRYLNGMGFDTNTKTFVDMVKANIINPAKVEINAVRNAVSVAAQVLTTTTVVLLPREEKEHAQPPVTR